MGRRRAGWRARAYEYAAPLELHCSSDGTT
jgi:hypothetical protein